MSITPKDIDFERGSRWIDPPAILGKLRLSFTPNDKFIGELDKINQSRMRHPYYYKIVGDAIYILCRNQSELDEIKAIIHQLQKRVLRALRQEELREVVTTPPAKAGGF